MTMESIIPSSIYRELKNAGAEETSPKKELGKNDFLTLLVAQLKHQDPMNPMASSEFSAQLAQFSSLEQLIKINDNLELLQGTKNGEIPENLLDYIGKEITSDDDRIFLDNGVAFGGSYSLKDPGDVIISIFDEENLEIRTIYRNNQDAGEYDVNFDGKDNNRNPVPDGKYSFAVQAFDKEGSPVDVSSGLSGRVTSVIYEEGIPYLTVGDRLINPESITEVSLEETI
jgi:flagellar basal-body rod modification protein FlgD